MLAKILCTQIEWLLALQNAKSIEVMQELYEPFIRSSEFFVTMDIKSAELTKVRCKCYACY